MKNTFNRTKSGLSNQHIFYKVDAVVYVEGGRHIDISSTKYIDNNLSIDTFFWEGIFSIYQDTKKFYFKPVGSKPNLLDIAKGICSGEINNVYVAMDRDFDNYKGIKMQSNYVIYTCGYSWENDVWQIEVLEDVARMLCGNKYIDDLKKIFNEFIDDIKIAIEADVFYSLQNETFIDRKKPLKYIKADGYPKLNPTIFKKEIELKCCNIDEISKLAKAYNVQANKDCYGHLLSAFCYKLVQYILINKLKSEFAPKVTFYKMGIDKFISKMSLGCFDGIRSHYHRAFNRP